MTESSQVKKLPKSEVEIILKIPWNEIKVTAGEIVEKTAQKTEIKGFRKGKAPKKMVEEGLDRRKVYTQAIEKLLPSIYEKIISENNLHPIISPKISLVSAEVGKDWEIKILLAEKPVFELGKYKEELGKLNKAAEIWIPGKGEKPEDKPALKKEEKIQKILSWLLENIKLEFSPLVLEDEVNRRLSQLLDQTQKLGLTVEQYLSSVNKTVETLKSQYQKEAHETFALELILGEIADREKITVEEKEIEEIIAKTQSEEEKKSLASQKYFLASLLRRQKTLDFLAGL